MATTDSLVAPLTVLPSTWLNPHRLNKRPPDIYFKRSSGGGIKFNSVVKLTKLGDDPAYTVNRILHEYRIHNCEVLFRDDCSADDLIDVIEGNRKYIKCLYAYNKVGVMFTCFTEPCFAAPSDHGCNCMRIGRVIWCRSTPSRSRRWTSLRACRTPLSCLCTCA